MHCLDPKHGIPLAAYMFFINLFFFICHFPEFLLFHHATAHLKRCLICDGRQRSLEHAAFPPAFNGFQLIMADWEVPIFCVKRGNGNAKYGKRS